MIREEVKEWFQTIGLICVGIYAYFNWDKLDAFFAHQSTENTLLVLILIAIVSIGLGASSKKG